MNKTLVSDQNVYYEKVWCFVRAVPFGKVVTYGQIAQVLPPPECLKLDASMGSASRLVGSAMASCPSDVPWHRVVNAQGKVSSRPGAQQQYKLLESEGLCFVQGKLDLDECSWVGDGRREKPKQQRLF